MKFTGIKGTRDFYPEDMALRNWLTDTWRRVSLRNGFQEYDGPILEYLDLYRIKSGDEIVEQLFNLTDRGGRQLAIRPEMTPTLARMVGARAQSLPRPVKWFSVPRLCRAERPQKGRLREFFQWNVDVVGVDDPLADAETILVAVDFLREAGLSPRECSVRINSRRLVAAVLQDLKVPAEQMDTAYALLDKSGKIPREALAEKWAAAFGGGVPFDAVEPVLGVEGLDRLRSLIRGGGGAWAAADLELPALEALFERLCDLGITEYCNFDMSVVRGLAYYTGVVYEIFDCAKQHRAIGGGGRYDSLLGMLGGPPMPGVGFGMGDVVILDVLREAGKMPAVSSRLDVYVMAAEKDMEGRCLQLAAALRRGGWSAEFSYRPQGIGKLLRAASERGAGRAVILGQETREQNLVTVKDLASGRQMRVPWDVLLRDPLFPMAEGT